MIIRALFIMSILSDVYSQRSKVAVFYFASFSAVVLPSYRKPCMPYNVLGLCSNFKGFENPCIRGLFAIDTHPVVGQCIYTSPSCHHVPQASQPFLLNL